MHLNAFQSYYAAINDGLLPVSILIEDDQGNRGIYTAALVFRGGPAEGMLFNADPKVRARAMVLGCCDARHASSFIAPDIHPVDA